MTAQKEKVKNFIDDQTANIAERTFGEEFLKLSDQENMSKRYKQSLRINTDSGKLILELDYQGEDGGPLGIWFGRGTKDHFIKPVKGKVLSWIEGGQRFFSKGHFVKGITERRIMERTVRNAMPDFLKKFKQEIEIG